MSSLWRGLRADPGRTFAIAVAVAATLAEALGWLPPLVVAYR